MADTRTGQVVEGYPQLALFLHPMSDEKTYTIVLGSNDLGQALEGLELRAQAYRNAEAYHATGEALFDEQIPEVNDDDEARKIAEHYERIIGNVRAQKEKQDKEP